MSYGSNDKFIIYICSGGSFEFVGNVPVYLPLGCFRTRLKLPVAPEKPMNRRILLKNVLKKLELAPNTPVSLRYLVDNHIFDITNDPEDFQDFLEHAITNAPIDLYVVDQVRMYQAQTNIETHQHNHNIETDNHQTNHRQQSEELQTHLEQLQIPLENINQCVEEESEMPLPGTEEFDLFNYGVENVCKVKPTVNPFQSVVSSSESDEEEEVEKEVEEKQDLFWNMPPLLSQQQHEAEFTNPRPLTYNVSELVKVGQTFLNKEEFINQLFTKCLEENFQIKPVKSDKSRYTAKCVLPNCEWKCSAYKIRHTENFIVKKLFDVHTCSRTQIMGNNKHATKRVLGNLLVDAFKAANREYKPKDIRDDIGNRFQVSISYNQAWRAKCHAIEMLRGSMDDSFRMLPIYLHNVKLNNPGSITNLVTDKESRFVMCYMSLGAVIRTFVQYVRPIIIVDGAHLKGGYLGTNLVAVAMDANNGILPLAYGIGEGETTECWSWFLGNLRDHLLYAGMGDRMSEITFISDRAPSIANGIETVFPEAFHAYCARHLFMNIKNKSNKFKYFEWHYWKMVKAYRSSDFQDHLSVFRRKLKASYKVLNDVGFNKWSRNQADHVRYSYMTSNSVESINALSKHARKLPVCMLLEFFRASIQDWYFKHHNTATSLTSTVTPYAERKLAKRTNKSRRWQVFPASNTLLEVRDGRKNGLVNLDERTCSCQQWQLSGIPCGHVIAVARFFGVQDVTTYVSHWFTSQTYINSYSEHISPLPHRSEWVDPGPQTLQIVNPPTINVERRQPGRPKGRNRIPSQGEETERKVRTCSRCKEPGHSRSTCSAAYDRTGESTSQRVKKSTTNSKKKGKEKVEPSEAYQSQFYKSYDLGRD